MNKHFGSFGSLVFVLILGIARPAFADEALTEHNKNIVRDFYTTVLIGRNVDAAPRFLRQITFKAIPEIKFPPG